jgi:2-keto-4-pentenoate hydratase/2-oxohepta-3-ene-1,7-dioic acid hydratase in catechol pathway
MKFVTFIDKQGQERVGAHVDADTVLDLQAATSPDRACFHSMLTLIEGGDAALALAREALDRRPSQAVRALADIRLAAPIPRPPRLRMMSLDPQHLKQAIVGITRMTSRAAPDPEAAFQAAIKNLPPFPPPGWYELPIYALMDHLCIAGPDQTTVWPSYSDWIDYELELACVIGKRARDVSEETAADVIFGYTILNDLSARDAQNKAQATGLSATAKGKEFTGGYPIGPCIVTRDEFDLDNLTAVLRVNGEEWGRGSAKTRHWTFERGLAYASLAGDVVPGEIISSGAIANCSGIEHARKGQRGDVVELEVSGIGVLRTTIA